MCDESKQKSASLEIRLRNRVYEVLERLGRPCTTRLIHDFLFRDIETEIRATLSELQDSGLVGVTASGNYVALPREETSAPETNEPVTPKTYESVEGRKEDEASNIQNDACKALPNEPSWQQVVDVMGASWKMVDSELGHFKFKGDDGTAVFLELPPEECASLPKMQKSFLGRVLLRQIEQVFGPRRVEVRSGRYRHAFKTPSWSFSAHSHPADNLEKDADEEKPEQASVAGARPDGTTKTASSDGPKSRAGNNVNRNTVEPPTVEEWLKTLDDDRAEILTCLFSGGQVSTLARARDISLTEARQLKKEALAGRPVLFEDRYRYLFRTYRVSSVTLKQLTGLGRLSYGYLFFMHMPGVKPLRPDALQDIRVPREIRDKLADKEEPARSAVRGMVRVDGELVSKNRNSLLARYGKQYVTRPMEVSAIRLGYHRFLSELSFGAGPDMLLPTTPAGCTQCLERTGSFLVLSASHIRYRPYSEYNCEGLREVLETYVPRDIECSTELIFREHPDLMSELDIRDAYELHVVIKHLLDEKNISGVYLEKRPIIRFGTGNRKKQAIELIKEMGPSSAEEVAAEYERRYGNSLSFFKTAVRREIAAYYKNGRFEYREANASDEQREYLMSLLGRDYQALDLVKAQFAARYLGMNELDVNDALLSELGYHIDCGLVVRDGVRLDLVFDRLVGEREAFSIRDPDLGHAVMMHPEFRKVLNRALNSIEVVEIAKDDYVSVKKLRRLFGVTKAELWSYADKVGKAARQGVPFTIHSLRKEGFTHKVDALREEADVEDCLYETLIATYSVSHGIKRTAMGGTMVFCKLDHKFSAADFLELIVKSRGKIEFDDLVNLLLDEYGITVPESTIRLAIERAVGEGCLFFNQSFQMLLPDKAANLEFLRELIDRPDQTNL